MTIRKKLTIGTVGPLLVLTGLITFTLIQINRMGQLQEVEASIALQTQNVAYTARLAEEMFRVIAEYELKAGDGISIGRWTEMKNAASEELSGLVLTLQTQEFTTEGMKSRFTAANERFSGIIALFETDILPYLSDSASDRAYLQASNVKLQELMNSFSTSLKEIRSLMTGEQELIHTRFERIIRSTFISSLLLVLLTLAASSILVYRVSRSILVPLSAAVTFAGEFSRGNLKARIAVRTENDEVGKLVEALNGISHNFSSLVQSVNEKLVDLSGISEETSIRMNRTLAAVRRINEVTGKVDVQMENQSASVNETSAAVRQITRFIDALGYLIQEQSANVTESSASIEQMVANIRAVNGNMEKLGEHFARLSSASDSGKSWLQSVTSEIREIADQSDALTETNTLISEIAGRTNLLAMNAAIEAVHAGAYGKGFAVVADEIRKLAAMATAQSKEIAQSLSRVKSTIDAASVTANNAGKAFEGILLLQNEIMPVVETMKASMGEQSAGSLQVLEALSAITSITSRVRDGSGEMQQAGSAIISETEQLLAVTQALKDGMNEISQGAREILTSTEDVRSMTGINSEHLRFALSAFGGSSETAVSEEQPESAAPAGTAAPAGYPAVSGPAAPEDPSPEPEHCVRPGMEDDPAGSMEDEPGLHG